MRPPHIVGALGRRALGERRRATMSVKRIATFSVVIDTILLHD